MFSFNKSFAVVIIAILLLFIVYYFLVKSGNEKEFKKTVEAPEEITGDIIGEESGEVEGSTFLGGLYRRKPKRHKKKKPSLNKNKNKKHGKPRK